MDNSVRKKSRQYLKERRLHFAKTQRVEHQPNNVDCDNWKEFFGSVQVPVWNLYFRREQSREVEEDDGDNELEEKK